MLSDELDKNNLVCVSGIDFSSTGQLSPDPKKGTVRRNIDHICISKDFIEKMGDYKIGAWDHFTDDGKYMSDHNGVYLEFKKL